jgi:hypothetical protein
VTQPATLKPESNGGQKKTTYFNRCILKLVMILQVLMLMLKLVTQVLEVQKVALFSRH